MMPAGLIRNTRPLDCNWPRMEDGSAPTTRLSTLLADEGCQQVQGYFVARPLPADERADVWPVLVERYPMFAEYQAATERLIPVVELVRQ